MTRLLRNRTAWASLALLILFIPSMPLVAEEPGTVAPAKTKMEQQRQEEEQRREGVAAVRNRYIAVMESMYATRSDELRDKMDRLKRLSVHLNFNGLSKEVQDKLIGNATQSLHETNTNILVKEALVAHLEALLEEAQPPRNLLRSARVKMDALEKQYQLAENKAKLLDVLVKKSEVSRVEAIHAQIESEQINAKLIEATLEADTLLEMEKKPIADKITSLKTELVGLNVKERITKRHLAQLHKSSSSSVDIELMQHDIDSLKKHVQELQEKLYHAKMIIRTTPTTGWAVGVDPELEKPKSK